MRLHLPVNIHFSGNEDDYGLESRLKVMQSHYSQNIGSFEGKNLLSPYKFSGSDGIIPDTL